MIKLHYRFNPGTAARRAFPEIWFLLCSSIGCSRTKLVVPNFRKLPLSARTSTPALFGSIAHLCFGYRLRYLYQPAAAVNGKNSVLVFVCVAFGDEESSGLVGVVGGDKAAAVGIVSAGSNRDPDLWSRPSRRIVPSGFAAPVGTNFHCCCFCRNNGWFRLRDSFRCGCCYMYSRETAKKGVLVTHSCKRGGMVKRRHCHSSAS